MTLESKRRRRKVSLVKKQKFQCAPCKRRFASLMAFDAHQDWTQGYLICCDPTFLATVDGRPKYREVRGVWHRLDGDRAFASRAGTAEAPESAHEALEGIAEAFGGACEGSVMGILGSTGIIETACDGTPTLTEVQRMEIESAVINHSRLNLMQARLPTVDADGIQRAMERVSNWTTAMWDES